MTVVIGDPTPSHSTGPATQAAALILNGLDLMMTEPSAEGYVIHASADGTTWGDPEAVIASIESQLSDGDLESLDRYGNRTATIALAIEAPDSSAPGRAVALGERALELACRWPGGQVRELAWTSPMAGAETTVTEMTTAVVSRSTEDDWDLEERLRGTRLFSLTIHARPFVRGTTPVTIEAPAVIGSTTTTVDAGSSTSGWSMLSTRPPAVTNLLDPDSWEAWLNATKSGAPSTSSGTVAFTRVPSSTSDWYGRSGAIPVTPGTVYRIQATVALSAGVYAGIGIYWYDSMGTEIYRNKVAWLSGPGSTTSYLVVTARSNAATMRAFVWGSSQTGSPTVSVSKVSVVDYSAATGLPDYWDGNTTDTAAVTYAWTGAADASTSTATWTAPTLLTASGLIAASVYGRASVQIRRANTGIDASTMASLPYLRIVGGSSQVAGTITVADNGSTITPWTYTRNASTGAFDIIVYRPGGFTSLDLTFTRSDGISATDPALIIIDRIDITDNPFGSGKVQSRQVQIYGSQRTELSLLVRGLGADGSSAVGLGSQTLVFTCATDDTRAKYASARRASGTSGTADSTATSGYYNAGAAKTGSPTGFSLGSGASLLPGTYDIYASVYITTAGTHTISVRVDRDAGIGAPITGAWQDVDVTAVSSGAVWPQLPTGAWWLIPVGTFTVAEADASSITLTPAASTAAQVRFDDLLIFHRTRGQLSLVDTSASSGSLSALRLDAATTTNPLPSVWVGVAGGAMMPADMTGRCQATEQHQAEPGVLQVVTITPGCDTTRVSASYYERYAFDYVTTAPRSVTAA